MGAWYCTEGEIWISDPGSESISKKEQKMLTALPDMRSFCLHSTFRTFNEIKRFVHWFYTISLDWFCKYRTIEFVLLNFQSIGYPTVNKSKADNCPSKGKRIIYPMALYLGAFCLEMIISNVRDKSNSTNIWQISFFHDFNHCKNIIAINWEKQYLRGI